MAEEQKKDKPKIASIDDSLGKIPYGFTSIRKMLEEEAGFKSKSPSSLEDRMKIFEHYSSPDTKFYERFANHIGKLVHGGHPEHEKGAKYYALNSLYSILKKDNDKLEKREDVWKVLNPFMDEVLQHLTYADFKALSEDIKKGKHDGKKYTDEEIFGMKARIFNRLIAAGQRVGKEKIMSIEELAEELRDKQRVEVEGLISGFADEVVKGHSAYTQSSIGEHYFKQEDTEGIRKYFLGKLADAKMQPKKSIAHYTHHELLGQYHGLLLNQLGKDYVKIKPQSSKSK